MVSGLSRRGLLRRAWVIAAAVAGVVLGNGLGGGLTSSTARGEAVLVVGSGASARGPGTANEATKLARTYAASIPFDDGVLGAAQVSLGWSRKAVSDALEITNDTDTAVLRIAFEAGDEGAARTGTQAVVNALVGIPPRAQSVGAGSLVLTRAPTVQGPSESGDGALPVGIVLGLLLGVLLAIALERADRRVDDVEGLAETLGTEASSLDTMTPTAAVALLRRWSAGRSRPTVALLAGVPKVERAIPAVAERLNALARRGEELRLEERSAAASVSADTALLVPGGVPGGEGAGERAALATDCVVLVIPQGARRTDVERSVNALRQLTGTSPVWGLLVGRKLARPGPSASPRPVEKHV